MVLFLTMPLPYVYCLLQVSTRIGFMEAVKGVKKRLEFTTGTRSNPIKKVIDLDIPAGVGTGHELRVNGNALFKDLPF